MGRIFAKFKQEEVPLEQLLASKVLRKILPLIDLLKGCYPNDVEPHVDLTFTLIDILCVRYPLFFRSDYFKTIIKDFFEIEPLKNLFIISKLVTEDNLRMNNYFLEFLTVIFTRNFENMAKIYSSDCQEINPNAECFFGLTELFIKYFDHFKDQIQDNSFMEAKMQINSKIEKNFLVQITKILETLDFKCDPSTLSFEQIEKLETQAEKLAAIRTKQAFLVLKLYNITSYNTYKIEKITIENLNSVLSFPLGHPLTNECFKLFTESILGANNVILNRLDINKSQHFILMENAFPLADKDVFFLIDTYQKIFDPKALT